MRAQDGLDGAELRLLLGFGCFGARQARRLSVGQAWGAEIARSADVALVRGAGMEARLL